MKTKLFTKTMNVRQPTDPRSQKLVDEIQELLKKQNVTEKRKLNECSHKVLKLTLNFFKNLSPGDDYSTEEVNELEVKFRTVLTSYGISGEEQQDEIFIGFFGTLNELGAEGVKE